MSSVNRLLWVDDDAGSVLVPLGRLLTKRSHIDIDIASDYATAIHLLNERAYSAALIDAILPPGPRGPTGPYLGVHLAEYISAHYPQITIVVLSVVPASEIQETLRGLHAEYFSKLNLFDSEEFDRLASLLRSKSGS